MDKLIGMGVESGPLGDFLQELDHFGALLLSTDRAENQDKGKKGDDTFHFRH